MVIIADCGSTKCDWLILRGGRDQQLENTVGFSPFFFTSEEIKNIISEQLCSKIDCNEVSHLWFYGTGIHDAHRAEMIATPLQSIFRHAQVEVNHDLLGSARAACGRMAGIACILGTGSNSCYFDGEKIIDNVPSLGWLLGDEGSGTHLGKALLRAVFYRELPPDLMLSFHKNYPEGLHAIKDRVYEKGANRYLAQFTKFLGEHLSHPFIKNLVADSLGEFLDRHVLKYQGARQVPVNFVGSIAYHFQIILQESIKVRGLQLGNIIRKPIYPLAEYHLQTIHFD